jgi:hypothetical protein
MVEVKGCVFEDPGFVGRIGIEIKVADVQIGTLSQSGYTNALTGRCLVRAGKSGWM